jgi:menaquinone-dependent protoporphyrinogen oxidase
MKIAICYATFSGQTEKVARFLQERLAGKGIDVKLCRCGEAGAAEAVREADAVLLGTPIRAGKPHPRAAAFARANAGRLEKKNAGLFLVCLTARDRTPEGKAGVEKYIEEFQRATGFVPKKSAAFAGALAYTKYNGFLRFLMKQINKKNGGDTDTSRDFEYTDWEEVRAFADAFAG